MLKARIAETKKHKKRNFRRLQNNTWDIIDIEMDNKERKQFMRFVTGCSSLPPGGLAALQPKMVVVKI